MRKLIIILALLVLPFQATWAAVATYCQHETSVKAANHIGHHEHQHEAKSTDTSSKSAPAADNDCTACHLYSASVISLPQSMFLVDAAEPERGFSPSSFHQFLRPDRPERPKWVRAA